jgi:hypothetical protein
MSRKQWGRTKRPYAEEPMPAPTKFLVNDRVHELGDSEIGVVIFVRRDGNCCLEWPSGRREWVNQSALCLLERSHARDHGLLPLWQPD